MTRHVALYRTADGSPYAQGPFPNRREAAMEASRIAATRRELTVEVVPIVDREVELGHVPIGVDEHGEGPVEDRHAAAYVCLECGCPAVARPQGDGKNALERLSDDLARAQQDMAAVRRDYEKR